MYRVVIIVLILTFALVGYRYFVFERRSEKPFDQPHLVTKLIQYQFEIQNTTNSMKSNVKFVAFAPVVSPPFQAEVKVTASYPYQLYSGKYGNQLLTFSLDDLAPYETRILTINAEMGSYSFDHLHSSPPYAQSPDFLGAQRGIEIHNQDLINQAQELNRGDQRETARAVYDWVRSHITYSGYNPADMGALYALKEKKGDCTEYAYLFAALSRINGIPTKVIGGFVNSGNARLVPESYHNWVEIFVGGSWLVVDPEKAMFADDPSGYIAMRVISDDSSTSFVNSHGLIVAEEGVQVLMK